MSGGLSLEIQEDVVIAKVTAPNGSTTQKPIDLADMATILASGAKLETGVLPMGTRFFSRGGGYSTVILDIPNHVRPISFLNRDYKATPVPRILCEVTWQESSSSVNKTSIFAVKDYGLTPDTTLHKVPFGNVFGTHANNVCWGSVPLPPVDSPSRAFSVIESFLGSKFNGHLSNGCLKPNVTIKKDGKEFKSNGYNIDQLLEFLNGNYQTYPTELIPDSTYTFAMLLSDLRKV